MADQSNIKSWYPVFGVRSYAKAVDYYVDWLGFNLDWEWREAPGQPAIVSISREGINIGLNESEDAATGAWLIVAVADVQALAEEWNGRRPGSVEVVSGVPYEGYVIYLKDPFGNIWFVSTHKEDLSPDEIRARAAKMFGGNPAAS